MSQNGRVSPSGVQIVEIPEQLVENELAVEFVGKEPVEIENPEMIDENQEPPSDLVEITLEQPAAAPLQLVHTANMGVELPSLAPSADQQIQNM